MVIYWTSFSFRGKVKKPYVTHWVQRVLNQYKRHSLKFPSTNGPWRPHCATPCSVSDGSICQSPLYADVMVYGLKVWSHIFSAKQEESCDVMSLSSEWYSRFGSWWNSLLFSQHYAFFSSKRSRFAVDRPLSSSHHLEHWCHGILQFCSGTAGMNGAFSLPFSLCVCALLPQTRYSSATVCRWESRPCLVGMCP